MNEVLPITPELLAGIPLPRPDPDADKNTRGTVLVVGSSALSPGAASLSGVAAFRAGAGKVLLAVPQFLAALIGVSFPEAGVYGFAGSLESEPDPHAAAGQIAPLLSRVDAALIGPGLSNEAVAQELASRMLDSAAGPAFILDALALTGLWDSGKSLGRHAGRVIITPHAGEMARLTGAAAAQVHADPVAAARQAALHLHCIVVLKGSTTVVAQPDGNACMLEANIVGLATSGSGDVLAGAMAGLIARGATPVEAALWSVYLHAQAGHRLTQRYGPVGLLARELPAEIPQLMHSMSS